MSQNTDFRRKRQAEIREALDRSKYERPADFQAMHFEKLDVPDDFVVVDTETTGVGRNDEVVELSVLDSNANELYHSFFKPETWIKPEATAASGLTNDMLANEPRFIDEWPKIYDAIDGRPIAGHNIGFDRRLIQQTLEKQVPGVSYQRLCDDMFSDQIDSMLIAKEQGVEYGQRNLGKICAAMGCEQEPNHRTSHDCLGVLNILQGFEQGKYPLPEKPHQMTMDEFQQFQEESKVEKHPILATVFYNEGDKKITMIPFDGRDNPEAAAAKALVYGEQKGYDHVGVSDMYDAKFANAYWRVSNGKVETGVSHEYSHPDWDDAKVASYYDKIKESGRTMPAPESIYKNLYEPWKPSKFGELPQPYEMHTKDMSFRDFSLMQLRETPTQAKALLDAGKMDPDMQLAWQRSGMNKENITGNSMAFTSEMLHLLPASYQPKSLHVTRSGLTTDAEAVIGGNLLKGHWNEDPKGVHEFGYPPDSEIAGRLVDNYLADKIKKQYDDLQRGYELYQNDKGQTRVKADVELNGQSVSVDFPKVYNKHDLTHDEITTLVGGGEVPIQFKDKVAPIKIMEKNVFGHNSVTLGRTDMQTQRSLPKGLDTPDVGQPEESFAK